MSFGELLYIWVSLIKGESCQLSLLGLGNGVNLNMQCLWFNTVGSSLYNIMNNCISSLIIGVHGVHIGNERQQKEKWKWYSDRVEGVIGWPVEKLEIPGMDRDGSFIV